MGPADMEGAAAPGGQPLRDVSGLDRNPAVYWPEPQLDVHPEPEDGPVLVMVSW